MIKQILILSMLLSCVIGQSTAGTGYSLTEWPAGYPMNQLFDIVTIDSTTTPWDTTTTPTESNVALDEVFAGLDFDNDGNQEFLIVTDESNPQNTSQGSFATGASLYLYEYNSTSASYELAWSWFDTTLYTGGASYPAAAITDFDGDGFREISLGIPYGTNQPCETCMPTRFYVWESSSAGLPATATATWDFNATAGMNTRPSSMVYGDVDGDGAGELAVYFRNWDTDALGKHFMIFSLNDDFDGEDTDWTIEYAFDGTNDSHVGSVYNATVISDVDEDGHKEVYIGSDYASFVEADAADTYTFYREVFNVDSNSTTFWPIGAASADADGDGFDEVYVGRGSYMVVINGMTDLATPVNADVKKLTLVEPASQTRGVTAGDFDGDSKVDVFLPGSWTGILTRFEFNGGSIGDSANWAQETALTVDSSFGSRLYTVSFSGDMLSDFGGFDIDGNGYNEVFVGSGAGDYLAPKLWIVDGMGTLAVDPSSIGSPILNTYALKQNYPNPFNPTTSIEFALQASAVISLSIYDLQGAEIAEIAHGNYPAGTFSVDWNGTNNLGQSVSSGVYLYSLQVGEFRISRQMSYIK